MKGKTVRYSLLIITGAIILLTSEIGLNLWIRSVLKKDLSGEAGPKPLIQSKISWIGLGDFVGGKVNRVWVKARNCTLKGLRYSILVIDSQGFRFNQAVLFKEKRLEITKMKKTVISGLISEEALNEYLKRHYSQLISGIRIKPGEIIIFGVARIFNNRLPVQLAGKLRVITRKHIRFYPTGLLIAGRRVSGTLVNIAGEQFPLEFGIMESWPLQITGLNLTEGAVRVRLQDLNR